MTRLPASPMGLDHVSDNGLVALCARGDRDALGALYDRYGRAAYSLARRILKDATLAEDAVQEAFLAIWKQAGRFDARRARPSTWILAVVHHKAIDIVRRETVRRTDGEEGMRDVAADEKALIGSVEPGSHRLPDGRRSGPAFALSEGSTTLTNYLRTARALGYRTKLILEKADVTDASSQVLSDLKIAPHQVRRAPPRR